MNDFGVAVWNDVREGAPCDEVNEWRQDVQDAGPPLTQELLEAAPAIQQECPDFGNTDIWAWSGGDPT